jgi:hypothetical protein
MELIDKYPPLESFKLSYVLEGLSSEYQMINAQSRKLNIKRQKEEKLNQQNKQKVLKYQNFQNPKPDNKNK